MLLLTAFLTPVFEFFDHWDPPGLGSDTEMAVFAFIFALCLVLIVCKMTAVFALLISMTSTFQVQMQRAISFKWQKVSDCFFVPPLSPSPLRI